MPCQSALKESSFGSKRQREEHSCASEFVQDDAFAHKVLLGNPLAFSLMGPSKLAQHSPRPASTLPFQSSTLENNFRQSGALNSNNFGRDLEKFLDRFTEGF